MMKKSGWNEWSLLAWMLPALSKRQGARVLIGPGDDAAVIQGSRCSSVSTTDALVEGTHFQLSWQKDLSAPWRSKFWRSLGWKSLAVNLSDLAAMGNVQPLWALVTAGFPPALDVRYIEDIYRGLKQAAGKFQVSVVGGDTVRSRTLFLSVALTGELRSSRALLRSGARAGDILAVTGHLGEARAGLELLKTGSTLRRPWQRILADRFFFPTPRMKEGRALGTSPGVGALMDVSDGLWRSLEIFSEASKVGYHVDVERLPLSSSLRRWAREKNVEPGSWAAAGGEDYELLFSCRPEVVRILRRHFSFTEVGRVTGASHGRQLCRQGKPLTKLPVFEHFS